MIIAGIPIIIVLVIVGVVYRHQCLLRDRAQLMRDAMRHRDFSFRLPTRGLLFGERALQNALNDMGHDIEKLVAHNEVESWQRLTRVLTHEIMNVITPIRSISQAYLSTPDIKGSVYEEGIQAIYDTSTGLSEFVSNYRKMTQLQEPVMTNLNLDAFCRSIASLYSDLKWEIEVPPGVVLRADESLLRQVFINLVKNAIEANAKTIGIKYIEPADGRPSNSSSRTSHYYSEAMDRKHSSATRFGKLLISNDGHIIPDDVAREIFIPFFTTKQRGSGIGLSLSRQILLMQGLLLSLADHPTRGYNVTFILESDKS